MKKNPWQQRDAALIQLASTRGISNNNNNNNNNLIFILGIFYKIRRNMVKLIF